jgi:DNA-binding transcriptional MerR regulator
VAASEKLYHKIGEVAAMLDVNTSVLRFWETQFTELAPVKTKSGQRLYSRQEVALLQEIYRLLYVQKLTIAGAKARLALSGKKKTAAASDNIEILQSICHELKELRKLLV